MSDYSDEFEKFCFEKVYVGEVFKAHLWEVWSAAQASHAFDRELMNEAAKAVLRFAEPTCMNDEKWRDRLEAMSRGEPG